MRFVVQYHICDDEHYDFMIEAEEALVTFRIPINDLQDMQNGSEIRAEKIQDHRKEYLEYEGPVSGGRGQVRIFDTGECKELSGPGEGNAFFLEGRVFRGNLSIKIEGNIYRFRFTQTDAK